MKGNLTNDDFMDFMEKVADLGENAKNQTRSVVSARNFIRKYLREIKGANDKETNDLNEKLISALNSINFKIDCLFTKLSIIDTLQLNCGLGYNNLDKIYIHATNAEKEKVVKTCIASNYMTETEIKNITNKIMLLQKKQVICVRNNKGIQNSVCSSWYPHDQHSDIIRRVSNVTLADVEYFIKSCPPGNVVKDQEIAICSKKEEFFSSSNVSELYWKLNQTQVLKAYEVCPLTQSQKDDICRRKHDSLSVQQVQVKYKYYPTEAVSAAFSSCQPFADLNEATHDKEMMCNLQKFPNLKYGKPFGESFWVHFRKKYGTTQIEDYIPTC